MSNQAQVDALEHLLLTLLRKNGLSLTTSNLFEDAEASVMGENNASGTEIKSESVAYLKHLKFILHR